MGRTNSGHPEIYESPDVLAGVWANHADIFWSRHEFTLDFVRLELRGDEPPARGVAVARVAMSSALMVQFIEQLQAAWQEYARRVLHQEISDDEF